MHRFAQIKSVLSVKIICGYLWLKYIRFKPASIDPGETLAPVDIPGDYIIQALKADIVIKRARSE